MNPYDHSGFDEERGPRKYDTPQSGLGGFVMTFVIMDLVWCSLRLVMAALGTVALGTPELEKTGLAETALWEVGTGFAMAAVGIPSAILILCRKPLGVALGWVTLAMTAANIGVGIWQASINLRQFEEGTPEYTGGLIGIGVVIVLRVGLNCAYLFALICARRRLARMDRSPSRDPRDE